MEDHINLCSECEAHLKTARSDVTIDVQKGQNYSIDVKLKIGDTKTGHVLALMFENEELFDYYVDAILNQHKARLKFLLRSAMPELEERIRSRSEERCRKCKEAEISCNSNLSHMPVE